MKKPFVIMLAVLAVCAGLAVAAWLYLPALGAHLLGKAINGTVEATATRVYYRDGLIRVELAGIRMRGNIEGNVGSCEIRVEPRKGIYVEYLGVSDFDITVKEGDGKPAFYPVPVELAEIRKGLLTYRGQKFVVRELKVTNFNTGKNLEFTIDGGIEGLGNLKTRGEGIFGEKRSDVKGDFFLHRVNLARVFRGYQGSAESQGTFTYRDEKLVMDGTVRVPHFSMDEPFLRRPLVSKDVSCSMHLVRSNETTDVMLRGLSYKKTPLSLDFKARERKLQYLRLTTDFLAFTDIRDHIDLKKFSEKDWGPLALIKDGKVRIDRLVFEGGKPISAQIYLRDMEAGNEKIFFDGVEGSLRIEGQTLTLTGFKARFGRSRLYDVSGLVPLKLDRDFRFKGRFFADVRDLAELKKADRVELVSGTTEGSLILHGRTGRGFDVEGAGIFRNARFIWRSLPLAASGNYTFNNSDINFDSINVKGESTDLLMKGKAHREFVRVEAKGSIDARHIQELLPRRYPMNGVVNVDCRVRVDGAAYSGKGLVTMTDLMFEVPGVMKKESGIESWAVLSVRGHKDGELVVDEASYTLDVLQAHGSGRATKDRIDNLALTLDVPRIDRASKFFFLDETDARGDMSIDLQVKDLVYPFVRLPVMKGYVRVRNGGFRLPGLGWHVKEIDLTSDFKGETFIMDVGRLKVGESVLSGARLEIDGIESPLFSLSARWDRFNCDDFPSKRGRRFVVPIIDETSLMARTAGTFVVTARQVAINKALARDAVLSGTFADRTLGITAAGTAAGGGELKFTGKAELTPEPHMEVSGSLKDVTAGELLSLVSKNTDAMEGKGSVHASLKTTGRDSAELLSRLGGTLTVDSSSGVIRKWNVLSKILALLNVYDLFRGRVDLTKEGLVYRKLSASFEGREGVFATTDFTIGSSSMVITGRGEVDVAEKSLDGTMTVSPLVAVDSFIDRLPLVRSIIKERKNGFLFFVYDVKGPIKDPDVRSGYIKSIGKRAIFILRNIFKLPKEVVDQLPKEVFER